MKEILDILIFFIILFGLISIPFWLSLFSRKVLKIGHDWEYRNPYDRTCKRCGRRECSVMFVGKNGLGEIGMGERWEVYYPLAHSPELCGGNKIGTK